jgi:hypothetical protein
VLVEGNGAMRQRVAFARGGMPAVLSGLVRETAAQHRPDVSAQKHRAHSR